MTHWRSHARSSSFPRLLGLSLAVTAVITLLLINFAWPGVRAAPNHLPVGLVAPAPVAQQLQQQLEQNRPGGFDIRDRSFEAQSNRASGLNLVVMVISVWNTVYLGRVVDAVRAGGETVPDEVLAHVSPLGWEHIGLTGDYLWREDLVPLSGTYRELGW